MKKRKPLAVWSGAAAALLCLAALLASPAAAQEEIGGEREGSAVYHSPRNLYYQASSHQVAYNPKTFVLIPVDTYDENWAPSTTQWSGRTEANYLVAYCSDDRTSSTTQGTAYQVYTLDNSRFTDDTQQRKVAAIIGHSYPFLTAEEMRQEIANAVDSGALGEEMLDCGESEWIAAAQWAIWSTTATTGQITVEDVGGAAFPAGHPEKYLNPLDDVGHTDEALIKSHVEALKNWLCTLEEPVKLAVLAHNHTITQAEDGSYTLAVNVELNRSVEAGEFVAFSLQAGAGEKAGRLPAGEKSFSAVMSGMSAEELADSRVSLTISGEHMQAYFYDSPNYQDMVGGSWEQYCYDLSFDLGLEKMDVSVSKVWTEQPAGADSVTVQLLANGEALGSAVRLHEGNNWSYTWYGLWKTDILGREIAYTVKEKPVDGYFSRLEQVDNYDISVPVWQEKEAFDGPGQYVIVSPFGALQATRYTDEQSAGKDDYITLGPIDLTCGSQMPQSLIWQAEESGENTYTLFSPFVEKYIYMSSYGYLSSSGSPLQFGEGHLYRTNSSGTKRYFSGFYSDEAFYVSSDEEMALDFRLYKLEQQLLPATDVNFLLTNTREEEVADITVSKVWAGRQDGAYPERAEVILLQNGRTYGRAELNEENGWRYTWSDLPVKAGGESVEYAIEEVRLTGYRTEVRRDGEYLWSYTVVNTWEGDNGRIKLKKTDQYDQAQLLSGAEFALYLASRSEKGELIPNSGGALGFLLSTVTTGENGIAEMTVSAGETYYLVETRAPAGYDLLQEAIGFTVERLENGQLASVLLKDAEYAAAQGNTLTVGNKVGVTLPQTGGSGAAGYLCAGLTMTWLGAALWCRRRRY